MAIFHIKAKHIAVNNQQGGPKQTTRQPEWEEAKIIKTGLRGQLQTHGVDQQKKPRKKLDFDK